MPTKSYSGTRGTTTHRHTGLHGTHDQVEEHDVRARRQRIADEEVGAAWRERRRPRRRDERKVVVEEAHCYAEDG